MSNPDPTMIHSDPEIWGTQGDFWPQKKVWAIFGSFLAIKWVKMAFETRITTYLNPIDKMAILVLLK